MTHFTSKAVANLFIVGMLLAPIPLRAQDSNPAGALYGNGVEAFFAGRSGEAESYLSQAMAFDSDDPRPYYFRAFSLLRQGRCYEARTDMQVGAEIEARTPNRFAIGKALERIQGPNRLVLERYRRDARLTAGTTVGASSVLTQPAGGAGVLRERRVVPLDEFSQPGPLRAEAVPDAAPMLSAPVPPAARPAEKPAAAPAITTDPFSDDAAPKAAPAKTPAPTAAPPKSPPLPPQPMQQPKAEDPNPFQ